MPKTVLDTSPSHQGSCTKHLPHPKFHGLPHLSIHQQMLVLFHLACSQFQLQLLSAATQPSLATLPNVNLLVQFSVTLSCTLF